MASQRTAYSSPSDPWISHLPFQTRLCISYNQPGRKREYIKYFTVFMISSSWHLCKAIENLNMFIGDILDWADVEGQKKEDDLQMHPSVLE